MCIIPCKDSTISANGKTNARKRLTPSPDGARRSCRVKQAEHHGHASTAREAAKPSPKAALTSASTDLSDPWAVIPGFNTSFSGERDVTKRRLPMKWVKNEDSPRETRHFGSPNGPFHTAICDVLQRKTADSWKLERTFTWRFRPFQCFHSLHAKPQRRHEHRTISHLRSAPVFREFAARCISFSNSRNTVGHKHADLTNATLF